jgi:hypothetical protein
MAAWEQKELEAQAMLEQTQQEAQAVLEQKEQEAQAALKRTELELKTALQENVWMRECWAAHVALQVWGQALNTFGALVRGFCALSMLHFTSTARTSRFRIFSSGVRPGRVYSGLFTQEGR